VRLGRVVHVRLALHVTSSPPLPQHHHQFYQVFPILWVSTRDFHSSRCVILSHDLQEQEVTATQPVSVRTSRAKIVDKLKSRRIALSQLLALGLELQVALSEKMRVVSSS
jgi:hypothetical protein